jgi:hypothetical protein
MGRIRLPCGAMVLLAAVRVAGAAVIDEADWTLRSRNALPVQWRQNGSARFAFNRDRSGRPLNPLLTLRLTEHRAGQVGSVWHKLRGRIPSFTFIADVRVSFTGTRADPCPGEGFTLAFADAAVDALGDGGPNLGIFNAPIPQFTAFEVNTGYEQGLGKNAEANSEACRSGKNETVAFDVMKTNDADRGATPAAAEQGGARIGQVNPPSGLRIVNGGLYRYQFDADGATNTLTLYVTGLEQRNKQFQKVKVLEQKIGVPILNFNGRFGLTAGTGATGMQVDVLYTRIEVPMVGSG